MRPTMSQRQHPNHMNITPEDLKQFATTYFVQAKQAGFTFEQLLKEANAVHPGASDILKTVFNRS
ncbi:hypothetical protein D3C77_85000 [compost metagenome]